MATALKLPATLGSAHLLSDMEVRSAPKGATATARGGAWPRQRLITQFARVASDLGLVTVAARHHGQRVPWTARLRANREGLDPALAEVAECIRMHYPRLILRWRRVGSGPDAPVYMRMSLLLDGASLPLASDIPGLRVLFDYGRSRPDPKPDASVTGGRRYYHGSPRLRSDGFRDPASHTITGGLDLGRLRSHRQAWSTYFWVDFFDPEDAMRDGALADAARWMCDEARECAREMRDYAADAALAVEAVDVAGRGIARAVRALARTPNADASWLVTPHLKRLLPALADRTPLERAARWACRQPASVIEPLRALVWAGVRVDGAGPGGTSLVSVLNSRLLVREITSA